jgi:hypothetical protein
MKKFFSVLLSIIFAVCLLGTLLLGVVRTDFSYSAITKIASEILKPVSKAEPVNDGLFHPGDVTYTLAGYEEYGDFGDFDLSQLDLSSIDMTNLDINELVGTYLEAAGIEVEPEFIAEVLASQEVSEFVDKYVGEVVNYMTGASEELNINTDDVLNVMNNIIILEMLQNVFLIYLVNYQFNLAVKEPVSIRPHPNAATRVARSVLSKDNYDFPVYFLAINIRQ